MNERTKTFMKKQRDGIYEVLNVFGLAIYEDEIAEDEEQDLLKSDKYNFFTLDFGDIIQARNSKNLTQTIVIEYYSENMNDVDETVIDVYTLIKKISGISFDSTRKERLRMKDTERYIDRVSIIFRRMIPIEC